MTIAPSRTPVTMTAMRRLLQLVLLPFWLLGFLIALIAIMLLVIWDAGAAGWRDGFDRHGGHR